STLSPAAGGRDSATPASRAATPSSLPRNRRPGSSISSKLWTVRPLSRRRDHFRRLAVAAADDRVVGPGGDGARVVDRVVEPAALVPARGAGDDQLGHRRDVAQLGEVAREEEVPVVAANLLLEEGDALARASEPAVAPHHAPVVPHEAAHLVPVLGDDDRLVAVGGPAGIPGPDRRWTAPVAGEPLERVGGGATREDQGLEQRVGGEAVGSVQTRAGHLAARVEPLAR